MIHAPKKQFSFKKNERLSSKKKIEELFSKGSSFYLYPFKVIYQLVDQQNPPHCSILITVPKRLFKRAVDRNLLKRRIRESYRLHKNGLDFNSSPDKTLLVAFIYTNKTILPFEIIQNKLILTISRLSVEINKSSESPN